jgi:hypothetical protein
LKGRIPSTCPGVSVLAEGWYWDWRARGLLLRFERGGGNRRRGKQRGKVAAAQGRVLLTAYLADFNLESLTVCHFPAVVKWIGLAQQKGGITQ